MISNLIPSKRIESITLCFNSDYKRPIHHRAVLYIKNEFYTKTIIKGSQYAKSMITLIQYNVRRFLIRKRLSISSELNYSFNTLISYHSINSDNNMYKRQTNPVIQKKILKLYTRMILPQIIYGKLFFVIQDFRLCYLIGLLTN